MDTGWRFVRPGGSGVGPSRTSAAIGSVVALAAGLSLAIEAMQIVIPGRDVDLTSVVLAASVRPSARRWWCACAAMDARRWIVPALVIWGLATLLAAWNPPRFTWPDRPFLRPEMIVPFWSYFGSRTLEDLTDVVGQAVVFLPLGALLAARSWRQSFLSAVLIGFGFGVVLEFGQAFLPDRTADVSDAISAAAGAGLGFGPLAVGRIRAHVVHGGDAISRGPAPVAQAERPPRRLAFAGPSTIIFGLRPSVPRRSMTELAFALWNPQSTGADTISNLE